VEEGRTRQEDANIPMLVDKREKKVNEPASSWKQGGRKQRWLKKATRAKEEAYEEDRGWRGKLFTN